MLSQDLHRLAKAFAAIAEAGKGLEMTRKDVWNLAMVLEDHAQSVAALEACAVAPLARIAGPMPENVVRLDCLRTETEGGQPC
jgi:hypothetical protein